ncbi:alpha/beta hydrolase [Lacihabitans soyangensis]|nr:alpha/beta fold hydrolase [Lacihabitans soyangensis]
MLKFLKFLIFVSFLLVIIVLFFQDIVILHPVKLPKDYVYTFDEPFEEINFSPDSNIYINGLLFRATNSKGLVFYNHGNADNLQRWGRLAADFTKLGYDVFFYDYQGFGKSSGRFSEHVILKDAVFLFDKLKATYAGKKIIIYGRSLGTGVATYVAKNRNSDALILETPYYNMADVGKSWLPFVPFQKFVKYKFPSNEWIKAVDSPITIFHGTSDLVVPYSSGLRLSKTSDCKLITIEGGGHKNLATFPKYHTELKKILE